MTIQFGRWGLGTLTLPNPDKIIKVGKQLSVEGWAGALSGAGVTTRAQMLVLRDQLANLTGPDEPTIPLVYSYDPTFNGYYEITSAAVTQYEIADEARARFRYSLTLERVTAYGLIECIMSGVDRTGKPATMINVFGPRPWHAVPSAWLGYDYGYLAVLTPSTRNLLGGGTVAIYDMVHDVSTPTVVDFYNATVSVGADPTDYYDGQVELSAGSPLTPVIGRQVVNDPTHWRLTNSLVQIDNSSGAGNHFTMSFVRSNGSQVDTAWGYSLGFGSGPSWTPLAAGVTPRSLTVLRNTPWVVTIRLAYSIYTGASSSVTLDITLRRGARYATFVVRSNNDQMWGINWQTTAACTAIDPFAAGWVAGYAETANNADGHRRVVLTGSGGIDPGYGTAHLSGVGNFFECAQGMQLNGAGASPDRGVDYQLAYFAAVGELDRIAVQ
ncbi:MAG: hypothetical protein ACEQSX_00370 [Baekduiaceae bacterium]